MARAELKTAGLDGCRAGWFAFIAVWHADGPVLDTRVFADFGAALKALADVDAAGIDIPIGLLDEPQRGGRECDRLARKALGWPRSSSVFTPPHRAILDARDYDQVRGHGLSIQAFHIMPKIREVDRLITPALQKRFFEAHPELGFARLAGHPMRHNKKTIFGREERLTALRIVFPGLDNRLAEPEIANLRKTRVAPDDVLDALLLCHVARKYAEQRALCLPPQPPRDAKGLDMAIWG